MEPVISDLVSRFERGALLTPRADCALALPSPAPALPRRRPRSKAPASTTSSVLVTDMARSIDFLRPRVRPDARQRGQGEQDRAARSRRQDAWSRCVIEPPPGVIDHFAIGVDGYNRGGGDRRTSRASASSRARRSSSDFTSGTLTARSCQITGSLKTAGPGPLGVGLGPSALRRGRSGWSRWLPCGGRRKRHDAIEIEQDLHAGAALGDACM